MFSSFFRIICPNETAGETITILSVLSKVKLEAFMWGIGTAIGELPPYLMARAARLAGKSLENENEDKNSKLYPIKRSIQIIVERVGFLGILAFASVCYQ